ncbi:DUF456 domain-containing protein [Bacillus sp. FJAT-42376]|uniref:DUF456 domain-containing protein n=1 Tax=Bacillus sp. FJAT-42376 TaxID=2014076 RepID=UPI000F4F95EE|nr:DUF456 domain-containing protein [Bacillus sp. FJAT-42376]AZB43636.1 DUF456 domain-containing protein [Bacillus sp. FJAT-42376]
MDIFYWILIIAAFVIAFAGLVYPIIPSVIFIVGGFLLYGWFYGFDQFGYTFWMIEGIFVAVLFAADYVTNLIGVKRVGGSRAAIWGSTIGLLVGPVAIPIAGILIGPFLGAVIAEMIVHRKDFTTSVKVGLGSLIGFISGVFAKSIIQLIMIGYFLFVIF